MRRLRNAILGIFREIFSRTGEYPERVITRSTRANDFHHIFEVIPSTGGLRIHAAGQNILVDADRSGGIAHLAKYWQYFEQNWNLITETVVLFYIFLAPSRGVINARQALWNFTLEKVKHALGNRFEAFFGTCERPPNIDCHADVPDEVIARYQAQLEEQGILVHFKRLLEGNTPSQATAIDSPQDTDGKLQGDLQAVVDEVR